MIHKIKKFRKLPCQEKKLFLEAWLTLGVMRAAILTVSFKRLTRSLQQGQNFTPPLLREENLQPAIAAGRAIARAANNTPWESACLAQALTAQRMLQKRNIPGVFFLGVRKNNEPEKSMSAHAWCRCGDVFITGQRGHDSFTIVSAFRW